MDLAAISGNAKTSDGRRIALRAAPVVPEQTATPGFIVVDVPPGEHTVSVSVRWCNAAGDLERTVIGDKTYYQGGGSAVADRATKDLDGDGTRETLELVDEGARAALVVRGSVAGRVDLGPAEPTFVSDPVERITSPFGVNS